jgi:superfamily II DNA or RNA helicase
MQTITETIEQETYWKGWDDLFGRTEELLEFFYNLRNHIHELDEITLTTIINSSSLTNKRKNSLNIQNLINAPVKSVDREEILNKIIEEIQTGSGQDDDEDEDDDFYNIDAEILNKDTASVIEINNTVKKDTIELQRQVLSVSDLAFLDTPMVTDIDDVETVNFLINKEINAIWQTILNGQANIVDELSKAKKLGKNIKLLKDRFLSEYKVVSTLPIPEGFDFRIDDVLVTPSLMQSLICHRVVKQKRYGNWSGTGAGKTLSAILASRHINAKVTVVVAFNSTINGWESAIKKAFPDSRVFLNKEVTEFDTTKHNYLIFNYEKFQFDKYEQYVLDLTDTGLVDFIVLDEIQSVKHRKEISEDESKRRKLVKALVNLSGKSNPELRVLGMSATPVINNLNEAVALLTLINDVEYDIPTSPNIPNCLNIYKHLTNNGLRYVPKYDIGVEEVELVIDGTAQINEIHNAASKGSPLAIEQVLLPLKLDAIIKEGLIKKGTIIYTQFVSGMVIPIVKRLREEGWRVESFVGGTSNEIRQDIINRAIKGEIDVLVGSSPVGTGVDGLQLKFDNLIMLSLPWTSAEYEQVVGRIFRQGSAFSKVKITIPQVIIYNLSYGEWSYDRDFRYSLIKYKRTIADAAVDGRLPKNNKLPSRAQLTREAGRALETIITRLESGEVYVMDRKVVTVPLNPSEVVKIAKTYGDFTHMNNGWYASNSENLNNRLKLDPKEWELYHTYYSKLRGEWEEQPTEVIADFISRRTDWVVADMGCGEDLLRPLIKNELHSFDHVAISDDVIACDIRNVPLEDNSIDVAVFSLSLMGSNYGDYLKEAGRVLKPYQHLVVCEPARRWEGRIEELIEKIEESGFKIDNYHFSYKFLYVYGIKK